MIKSNPAVNIVNLLWDSLVRHICASSAGAAAWSHRSALYLSFPTSELGSLQSLMLLVRQREISLENPT